MNATDPSKMLEVVRLAAQIMLENGAETYRVEDTVVRLCRSFGYGNADAIALSTGVFVTVSVPGDSQSTLCRVRKRGINLTRVNAVNALSRRVSQEGMDMDDALRALRQIQRGAGLMLWHVFVLAGLVAGSFALMFGGSWLSFGVAVVCGVMAQISALSVSRLEMSLVLVALLGGLVCSLVTMGAYYLFGMTPAEVETTLAAAIMPLISGLMMTNAARDALRGDLLSGIARSVEALLVAVMVALGISLALRFYMPGGADGAAIGPPWYLAVLYAGIATATFCPLLRVPRQAILAASLLGAASYGGYLLAVYLGAGETLALLLAAALVTLLCDRMARHMKMIATIFMCAALIPLVPGLGLYRTMYALLQSDYAPALELGVQTLLAVGAIALGTALGSLRLHRPRKRRG